MKWLVLAVALLPGIGGGAAAADQPRKPDNTHIAVTPDGTILWDGKPIACEELNRRLAAAAPQAVEPPRARVLCPPAVDKTKPNQ